MFSNFFGIIFCRQLFKHAFLSFSVKHFFFAGSHNWWFLINCQVTDSWQPSFKQKKHANESSMKNPWNVGSNFVRRCFPFFRHFPFYLPCSPSFTFILHFQPLTIANKNCQILLPASRLAAFFARNFHGHEIVIAFSLSLAQSSCLQSNRLSLSLHLSLFLPLCIFEN